MDKTKYEFKTLALVTLTGYLSSAMAGMCGLFFPVASYPQLLLYQINDALGITASVIAARYVGLRGQHVAASALILMGITHGISMASSGLDSFNVERGVVMVMPMIPALVLMYWCDIFPAWLRIVSLVPAMLFVYMYVDVVSGGEYYGTSLWLAYSSLMAVELMWSVYIYKDWLKMSNNLK